VSILQRTSVAAVVALTVGASLTRASTPDVFAIRDARLVTVSGAPIESGAIVISRGVITAVGANVPIPPGAWVIDGKGLTVYPGLIDGSSDLGLTSGTAAPATPAGGGGQAPPGAGAPRPTTPPARGPQDRPASTPWLQAADDLKADDRRLEAWRSNGFTTALTAPKTGILPGQGAVINLAGSRPGELVLRAPATLQLNLQPSGGFGSFPGSLMGVVSYVRQVFLDADQDLAASKSYGSGARGQERPAYDRTLRALQQAEAAKLPVLIAVQTPVQIERALNLSKELKLTPVLVGAHHGYRATAAIVAAKAPVIVSLKWPERDNDNDPEAEETLKSLRLRALAPSTPAALEKAGVLFAFSSDGVQARDLLKNVRKAIEAGLASDAALRALTVNAARILGVADRTGTLEPGKIANLVVTDGDLFAEKTKIRMTFVDGVKFEPAEPARPSGDEKPTTNPSEGR
jgi:imidazolonepropionase-like amidohydrolase